MQELKSELILDPRESRINLYPIQYPDIWEYYNKSKASYWTPEEIDLIPDISEWKNKLTDDERFFIKRVLAFFANSDFIVNENLDNDFASLVTIPEIRFFYHFQEMMEDIHSDTYIRLINTYVENDKEKEDLLNTPEIREKTLWAMKWISPGKNSFVQRLVAFAIVEGIFFSGSFCAIFWLKKRGLLQGLSFSNKLISRDEGMHRDFACLLYRKYIVNKLEKETLLSMLREAVDIEKSFINEAIPVALIGMNKDLMSQYIEFVADHLLYNMIEETYYHSENPFPWMTLISLENKENFFDGRVSSYCKTKVMSSQEDNNIVFNADF